MVSVTEVIEALAPVTLLKFFPTEKAARTALIEITCQMATDLEQVKWTVKRMLVLYNEWPGPQEFRAVFCSRYKPKDGIDIIADTKRWPDGLPPDPDLKTFASPPVEMLPPAETADPLPSPIIPLSPPRTLTAEEQRRERREAYRVKKLLGEMLTAPANRTDPQPEVDHTRKPPKLITQCDIDEAIQKNRNAGKSA